MPPKSSEKVKKAPAPKSSEKVKKVKTRRCAKNNTTLPFIIHTPTEHSGWPAWWDDRATMKLRVLSIDPGITHFCMKLYDRVGDKEMDTVSFVKTNVGDRTNLKQKKVSNNMESIDMQNVAETRNVDVEWSQAFNSPFRIYGRISHILDTIDLSLVHVVVVESQMKINYKMTRLGQHILGYFINKATPSTLIVEVDSKLKTMGVVPKPDNVKKWAVERARVISTERNDKAGLAFLELKGKVNDFADTTVQGEAFFEFTKARDHYT